MTFKNSEKKTVNHSRQFKTKNENSFSSLSIQEWKKLNLLQNRCVKLVNQEEH